MAWCQSDKTKRQVLQQISSDKLICQILTNINISHKYTPAFRFFDEFPSVWKSAFVVLLFKEESLHTLQKEDLFKI